jgi:hypothetical protein
MFDVLKAVFIFCSIVWVLRGYHKYLRSKK